MDTTAYGLLSGVLVPVGLIIAIGFWFAKNNEQIDTVGISRLVMLAGTPALIFSTLTTTDIPYDVLLEVSLGALCVCVLAILVAVLCLKFLRLELSTYLPSLTMPNSANLGLPLALFAFGNEGLAFGVAFYFVVAIFQYTVMPIVVADTYSVKAVLKEPLIWAVAATLYVVFTDLPVPSMVANTTKTLGDMVVPLMLLLLGASIARLGFSDIKETLKLAVLRLVIGLGAGIITIFVLGTSGVASGTIFLMAAMPSALVTYVLAARYDRHPQIVAGLVVASTLLTLLVLPLLIILAAKIATIG